MSTVSFPRIIIHTQALQSPRNDVLFFFSPTTCIFLHSMSFTHSFLLSNSTQLQEQSQSNDGKVRLNGKKGRQSPRNKYSFVEISHTKCGHHVSLEMPTCSQLLCTVQTRPVPRHLGPGQKMGLKLHVSWQSIFFYLPPNSQGQKLHLDEEYDLHSKFSQKTYCCKCKNYVFLKPTYLKQ